MSLLEDRAYIEGLKPKFTAGAYRGLPTSSPAGFFRIESAGQYMVGRHYRDEADNQQTKFWQWVKP